MPIHRRCPGDIPDGMAQDGKKFVPWFDAKPDNVMLKSIKKIKYAMLVERMKNCFALRNPEENRRFNNIPIGTSFIYPTQIRIVF